MPGFRGSGFRRAISQSTACYCNDTGWWQCHPLLCSYFTSLICSHITQLFTHYHTHSHTSHLLRYTVVGKVSVSEAKVAA